MGVDKLEAGAFAKDRGDNRVWRRHLLLFGALLGLLIVLYWASWTQLVGIWINENTYTYCFLIPLVSLYVLYARWNEVTNLRPGWSLLGALASLGGGLLWLLSDMADVDLGRQVALVVMLQGIVLSTFGWRVFWGVFFPLQYLWLMIPGWTFLIAPLQEVTLVLSEAMIRVTGVPLFVEGLIMEVPSGLYRVAPECSGLNFVLAAAALSLVFGNLMYNGLVKRAVAVVVSLAMAVLANGFRVAVIILFNHWGGTDIGLAGDHLTWGWGFFSLVVLLMIWLGSRFVDHKADQTITMDDLSITPRKSYSPLILMVFIPFLGATVVAPYAYAAQLHRNLAGARHVTFALPDRLGDAVSEANVTSRWQPEFPRADAAEKKVYATDDGLFDVFVAYYGVQRAGREVVAFDNDLIGDRYRSVAPERAEVITIDGQEIPVVESLLGGGKTPRLVWYWYWIDGRYTRNSIEAKLLQAKANLLGGEQRAALVAVSTELPVDVAEARSVLEDWLRDDFPVTEMLRAADVSMQTAEQE